MSNVRVMRCRLMLSRKFTIADRLKFLMTGRMYVAIANGKPHTTVVLTMERPKEKTNGTE